MPTCPPVPLSPHSRRSPTCPTSRARCWRSSVPVTPPPRRQPAARGCRPRSSTSTRATSTSATRGAHRPVGDRPCQARPPQASTSASSTDEDRPAQDRPAALTVDRSAVGGQGPGGRTSRSWPAVSRRHEGARLGVGRGRRRGRPRPSLSRRPPRPSAREDHSQARQAGPEGEGSTEPTPDQDQRSAVPG